MKELFLGPAGRFGLGVAIGVIITRIVDGNGIGSALAFGVVAGLLTTIIHGMISSK